MKKNTITPKMKRALFAKLSRISTVLAKKRLKVCDIEEERKMELGYTLDSGSIHIATEHKLIDNLSVGEKLKFVKGVWTHEMMHQLLTNFAMMRTLDRPDIVENYVYHEIFNIVEDARIENFASEYIGGSYTEDKYDERGKLVSMSDLTFSKRVVYRQSPRIDEVTPSGKFMSPYSQLLYAMIEYGDCGIIKGKFTSPEAKEIFAKVLPIFDSIIEEGDFRIVLRKAVKIAEITRPLWEKDRKAVEEVAEMLKKLGKDNSASTSSGSQSPSSSPSSGSYAAKKRKTTRKKVKAEDINKVINELDLSDPSSSDSADEVTELDVEDPENLSEEAKKKIAECSKKSSGNSESGSSKGKGSDGEGSSKSEDSDREGSTKGKSSDGEGSSKGEGSDGEGSSKGEGSDGEGSSKGEGSDGEGSSKGEGSDGEGSSKGEGSDGEGSSKGEGSDGEGSSKGEGSDGEGSSKGEGSDGEGSSKGEGSDEGGLPGGKGSDGKDSSDGKGSNGEDSNKNDCDRGDSSVPLGTITKDGRTPSNDYYSGKDEPEDDDDESITDYDDYVVPQEEINAIIEDIEKFIHSEEKAEKELTDTSAPIEVPVTSRYFKNATVLNRNVIVNSTDYNGFDSKCGKDGTISISTDYDNYNNITAPIRPSINTAISQFKRLFRGKRSERVHKSSGKVNIERMNSGKISSRVFDKTKEGRNPSDIAIFLLLDESGSMSSNRRYVYSRLAAIGLSEMCEQLQIPIYVMGFSADEQANGKRYDAVHMHYIKWKNNRRTRLNLLAVNARANNFDGFSIRYATKILSKRHETNKILIVISDGAPACHKYNQSNGISDAQLAVKEANRSCVALGVAIGSGIDNERIKEIYGENYLGVEDVSTLFQKIVKKLRRMIKEDI